MAENDHIGRGQDANPQPSQPFDQNEQDLDQGTQHIPGYYPELTPEMMAGMGITPEQYQQAREAMGEAFSGPLEGPPTQPGPDAPPQQPGAFMTLAGPQQQQLMAMGFQRGAVIGTIFGGLIIGGLLVAIVNSKRKTPAPEKTAD